jgi:transposase-like protein
MVKEPTTLQEAVLYFADADNCRDYIVAMRWPSGITCPTCGAKTISYLKSVNRFQCSKTHPKRQFTVKTGTIFEDSPLGLDKWLMAMWLVTNCKNGISSYELHRSIGVCQKTAWFMNHRIRLAMQKGSLDKIGDDVEIDETYIGGKARNMHEEVRARKITGTGGKDKAVVFGMLERGGEVRLKHVDRPKKKTLEAIIDQTVMPGSRVYTDALKSYDGLSEWYRHQVIDHSVAYVEGLVHTNGMENFWSLLKRTIGGTYVSVEPFHLHRYLDEQAFRFNERKGTDGTRFKSVASQVSGRRLTYKELTGKNCQQCGQ